MVANIKKLCYFGNWSDKSGEQLIKTRPDIETTAMQAKGSDDEIGAVLHRTHGYMIGAGVASIGAKWFANDGLLPNCKDLLAVCSSGAGFDTIDVESCTKHGIIACNQSGANLEAVAEHALGFMLMMSKKIALSDKAIRKPGTLDRELYWGNDIIGKTVGIIGVGNIGTRTAELCGGLFRMEVLGYDPYVSAEEMKKRGARKVELDELLAKSDFVTVHVPKNKETTNMMGAAQFAKMKPTAFFLNTARGGLVDEDALYQALVANKLAGAALDVFLKEPPTMDHPLLSLDNFIGNPHIAGVTAEARRNIATWAAEQWITIFDGGIPPRLINHDVWPAYCDRFERVLGFRPKALS